VLAIDCGGGRDDADGIAGLERAGFCSWLAHLIRRR
jgi:hypothetical protein